MLQTLRSAFMRHFPRHARHSPSATGLLRLEPEAANSSLLSGPGSLDSHAAGEAGRWFRDEAAIMGTAIHVELWADNPELGAEGLASVMREMRRIDAAMSPHKTDSELTRINRLAWRQPVLVSGEMFGLLESAQLFSSLSEGAFDITYASAGRLYDYREGLAPDAATLAAALPGIGWRQVQLDALMHTVEFSHPATRIDLGGFAKGHAVDRAAAELKRLGIQHAYISAGGDSRVIGDRRGRPWQLGIRDPRRADQLVAVLPLEDVSVSTSGDYERCFVRDGRRVHHLIDPATGLSASGARSVTVLAPDGLTAEALSKAIFVRGPVAGLALIERVPGADAVVVDEQGRLHRSSGLLMEPAPPVLA